MNCCPRSFRSTNDHPFRAAAVVPLLCSWTYSSASDRGTSPSKKTHSIAISPPAARVGRGVGEGVGADVGAGTGAGSGVGVGAIVAASAGVGGGIVAGTAVEVGTGEGFGGTAVTSLTIAVGNEVRSSVGAANTRAVAARFPISGARMIISLPLGWTSGFAGKEVATPAFPSKLSSIATTGLSGEVTPGTWAAWEVGSGVMVGIGLDRISGSGRITRAPSLAGVAGGSGSEYGVGIGIGTTSRLAGTSGPRTDATVGGDTACRWSCWTLSAPPEPQPADRRNAAVATRTMAQTLNDSGC